MESREKIKNGLKEFGEGMKEEIKEHVEGVKTFAIKSPFLFGRYLTLETVFVILMIHHIRTGEVLDWVSTKRSE